MTTPKSILKKKATPQAPTTKSREERNLEIALHHANLIQSQKDTESQILSSTETLIDYPPTPSTTSSRPSPSDVQEFIKLIHPFTPGDYDELIDERRLDGKCGYVFCRNKPKTTPGGGAKKIVGGGKVVDRGRAESWCSAACARRALYVKVQLIETPAWERRGGVGNEIEVLMGEEEEEEEKKEGREAGRSVDVEEVEGRMRELALERGDGEKPARAVGMVREEVVERGVVRPAVAPERRVDAEDAEGAVLIEGYAPRLKKKGDTGTDGVELGDRELNI